jgi:hypothetical protein
MKFGINTARQKEARTANRPHLAKRSMKGQRKHLRAF